MDKDLKLIRTKGKCCITGMPLQQCKNVNMVMLNYKATWHYPIWGNVITKQNNMAVAYVHDVCITEKYIANPFAIKYAVEINNNEIIYHPVEELQMVEIKEPQEQTCRQCGCTMMDPCLHPTHGYCGWAEEDLCTHCRDYPGQALRISKIKNN